MNDMVDEDPKDLKGLLALPPRASMVLGGPDLQTRDERNLAYFDLA